jgi:hypothetical protein
MFRRPMLAVLAALALSQGAIAQVSVNSGTSVPAWRRFSGSGGVAFAQPYNLHYITGPGDSRRALGGGFTGVYGISLGLQDLSAAGTGTSFEALMGVATGHIIRPGVGQISNGIGGQNAENALTYPRPDGNPWTGRIDNGTAGNAGNTYTVTAKGGGSVGNTPVGSVVTCPVCIPAHVTAVVSETGSTAVFTIDGSPQNVASRSDTQVAFVFGSGMTIADVAAHEGAIVFQLLGTNSADLTTALAAVDTEVKALTTPGMAYPGFRPGGEGTDQPLPLYPCTIANYATCTGNPKTIVLFDEMRNGIDALGNVNGGGSQPAALHTFATSKTVGQMRYSYNSGNATYANPHVLAVDTFDSPVMADLADTTNYYNKAPYQADGLHPGIIGAYQMDTEAAALLVPLLTGTHSFAVPIDANTASTLVFTQNPLFTTHTGGTTACSGGTINGSIPQFWKLQCGSGSAATGLTLDVTTNTIDATHGDELIVHVTGTASGNARIQWIGTASTTQRGNLAMGADTMRGVCRYKLAIAAGSVTENELQVALAATGAATSYTGMGGGQVNPAGYGNNASAPQFYRIGSVGIDNPSSYLTVATKNVSLVGYATGTPTTITTTYTFGVKAGVLNDVTLTISQCAALKVTD